MKEQLMMSGADHSVMRELNRSLVLDVLKRSSPISRAAIAKATGLAKPTVSAIVDDLLQEGLVREIGVGETTAGGGRPPILLEFNARSQYVIGVQIGVHSTITVLADARGVEVARAQRRTTRRRPPQVLARIVDDIRATLTRVDASFDRLAAVGVCVPGLLDREAGLCLLAPNLGWKNVSVGPTLYEALGVPIYVHNTAQAAAVAESVEGAAQDASEVVFLYVGSGIGAGLLTGGHLYHGLTGIAGEIGHCAVPGAKGRCNCGKIGCLETVASAPSIALQATEALRAGRPSSLADVSTGGEVTPEQVATAAADGDELAVELLGRAGRELGMAASWMVNLCNPEMLVVGGGLVEAGPPLLDPLREAVFEHSLPHTSADLEFAVSDLGQDAEVRGAVLLALQSAETYYRAIFQS